MRKVITLALATGVAGLVPGVAFAEDRLDLSLLPLAKGGIELRYGQAEAGSGFEVAAGLLPLSVSNEASTDDGWLGLLRAGYLVPLSVAGEAETPTATSLGLRLSGVLLQAALDDGLRDRSLYQTGAAAEAVVTLRWRLRADIEVTGEAGLLGGYGWGMATAVRKNETGRTEGPFWAPSLHLLVGRRW
jgi:hypothetical protein